MLYLSLNLQIFKNYLLTTTYLYRFDLNIFSYIIKKNDRHYYYDL